MTHPTTEDNSVLVMMLSLLFPRFQQIRSNFGGLLFALAKSTYFSSSALRVPHNFDLGDELKGVGRGGGGDGFYLIRWEGHVKQNLSNS